MAVPRRRKIRLDAPYLRRVWLDEERRPNRDHYPFNLPILRDGLDIAFESPITLIVGENGTGKSTLLEAIAALAGYDEAGGGKGYMPVDHSQALDRMGRDLASALRASWLPKITRGWFFRAESFFSVARYLDLMARLYGGEAPDFLSHSHGEGFLRFFDERCDSQGIFILDEPESALSPSRQVEFLRLLRRMERSRVCQVIAATHSPMLMAYPGAALLRLTPAGPEPVRFEDTEHFRLLSEFFADPRAFVAEKLAEEPPAVDEVELPEEWPTAP